MELILSGTDLIEMIEKFLEDRNFIRNDETIIISESGNVYNLELTEEVRIRISGDFCESDNS